MIIKRPQVGERKTKVKFCIFPIATDTEIFWFEKVKIEYEYLRIPKKYSYGCVEMWEIVKVTSI